MCAPGFRSDPSKTGVAEVVAVQITSASATASEAFSASVMVAGAQGLATVSSAKARDRSASRLKIETDSIARTVQTASSCVRACTPDPSIATRLATDLARRSVAAPEPAPVRMAVRVPPSMSAIGIPVSGSSTSTSAWMVGSFWRTFFGNTETTLSANSPVSDSSAGINRETPS